jgi:hypothetical protein
MRAPIGTVAMAAVSLLGGCGPAPEPSRTVGASVAATASAGPAATPPPSSGAVTELTASPAPLPPGTYTVAAFRPRVTLDIDGSWTSVNRFDDFFDVQQDVGSPDVIAVQIARPSAIVGANGTTRTPADAVAAKQLLAQNPGLRLVEESESRMSGLTGPQATFENTSGASVEVMVVARGTVSIDSERRLWIAFFPTPDGVVTVMIGGSVATWDHALLAAEPVLETVRIGE